MARGKCNFRATSQCAGDTITLSASELQQLIGNRQNKRKPAEKHKISSGPAKRTPKNLLKVLKNVFAKQAI